MTLNARPDVSVVFFDLGYTLINFEGDFHQVLSDSYLALAESLVRSGIQIDPMVFSSKFEQTISEYYRTREIDLIERPVESYLNQTLCDFGYSTLPDEIIQKALTDMYQFSESFWHLEPDAITTLKTLKGSGYQLGLITNAANAPDSNRLIDKFQLRDFFEVILISAEEKIRKPDTRIYSRALQRLKIFPDQAVMVGDTLTADILGAQNSGMHAIWIKRRADRPENHNLLTTIQPDAVIDTLTELPAVLQTLE